MHHVQYHTAKYYVNDRDNIVFFQLKGLMVNYSSLFYFYYSQNDEKMMGEGGGIGSMVKTSLFILIHKDTSQATRRDAFFSF